MLSALLLALREGVEAALVVGIVLVYLNRTGRRALTSYVWGGVMLAVLASFAAAVLLTTIGRQVYTQWRDGTSKGLSRWLFIGQITASIAFIAYSWLLGNWVFVVTNALMLVTAALGQWVYLTNRQQAAAG